MAVIAGTPGPDRISGGDEDDHVEGREGADTLYGGGGRDTLEGGPGADHLSDREDRGLGADILRGGDGDDIIWGTDDDIEIDGGAGNDVIHVRPSGDTDKVAETLVRGGDGDDRFILEYATERQVIDGGLGFDTLTLGPASGAAPNGPRPATYVVRLDGPADGDVLVVRNVERVLATGTNLQIYGSDAPELLDGRDYRGGFPFYSTPDLLSGGGGNDTLLSDGGDTLLGGAGDDLIEAMSAEWTGGGGPRNGPIGDLGALRVDAGPGADTVRIFVQGSVDQVTLGAGADTLVAKLHQNPDYDPTLTETVVTDFQTGAGGDRVDLSALRGPHFAEHRDPFEAGVARLVQSGSDTLLQFDDRTVIVFQNTTATSFTAENFSGMAPFAYGGYGTAGADSFVGGDGSDSYAGRGGADTLAGGPGSDRLAGGYGDDVLSGGSGDDWLHGGPGFDVALFDYRLTDATVSFRGDIAISRAGERDVVAGIDRYVFADGTVEQGDNRALVDDLFYLSTNKDVYGARFEPEFHYDNWGWREGRDPNPLFDTTGYLGANADVKQANFNPLFHYDVWGWLEGRDPSADFDTRLYLLNNPDVRNAGLNPLTHYLEFGRSEGRAIYSAVGEDGFKGLVDVEYYLLANPDVAAAQFDPKFHYDNWGWREGRDPNSWFDSSAYLDRYADVRASGMNPLDHYLFFGGREGRDPSPGFDSSAYLSANPDVFFSGMNPLLHYLQFGIYEGRSPWSDGVMDPFG
jgi:Ca2+-binding RTX toxin-like protein